MLKKKIVAITSVHDDYYKVVEDDYKWTDEMLEGLVEDELTAEEAHGIANKLGLKRPAMYDMGYPNNNCIGCVKGGMGYWNKIRVDFPEVFERRAKQEREIGRSCINGVFLDELEPNRGNINTEVMEDCTIACQLLTWNK